MMEFSNKWKLLQLGVIVFLAVSMMAPRAFAAPTPFVAPSLTVSPTTFGGGQTLTISGVGFPASTNMNIWFDTNSNNKLDSTEPQVQVKTSSSGYFNNVQLTVSGVPDGNYYVEIAPATGSPGNAATSATAPVTVNDPTILNAMSGISTTISSVLTAISNAVTHLDASIAAAVGLVNSNTNATVLNAQNSINAHTDSVVPPKPNAILISKDISLNSNGHGDLVVLPYVQGQTYSGHMSAAVDGQIALGTTHVECYYDSASFFDIAQANLAPPGQHDNYNLDFTCDKVVIHVAYGPDNGVAYAKGVVQYQNATNVSSIHN